MANNNAEVDYDNVNGVKLSLKIDKRSGSPNTRQFTVSYKSDENKASWPKISLFISIVFNIIALIYIRINLTAIFIIIIVLSFLVFFWITHSVQSESFLIIPTVGIQSSVKYVWGREDSFVQWSTIDDIVINEVIKLNRVVYYLSVIIKRDDQTAADTIRLLPIFKYTKPRILLLETIYTEIKALLTDAQNQDTTMGSGDIG